MVFSVFSSLAKGHMSFCHHLASVICHLYVNFYTYESSPLKPFGQMNHNLVGSIYGRSSMEIAHLVMIRYQIWPPQAILVSDWLISKISSPLLKER